MISPLVSLSLSLLFLLVHGIKSSLAFHLFIITAAASSQTHLCSESLLNNNNNNSYISFKRENKKKVAFRLPAVEATSLGSREKRKKKKRKLGFWLPRPIIPEHATRIHGLIAPRISPTPRLHHPLGLIESTLYTRSYIYISSIYVRSIYLEILAPLYVYIMIRE